MNINNLVKCRRCKIQKPIPVGSKIGMLTVIAEQESFMDKYPNKNGVKNRHIYIMCECDCGTRKYVRKECLRTGGSKSCGCNKFKSRSYDSLRKGTLLKDGKKKCSRCLNWYKKEMFYKDRKFEDKLTVWCKLCYRLTDLCKRFKVTDQDILNILEESDNRCQICGVVLQFVCADNKNNEMFIDHCHKSNKVRGVLCRVCNFGMHRYLNDNSLDKMIEYLKGGPFNFLQDNVYPLQLEFRKAQLNKLKFKYGCTKQMLGELMFYFKMVCPICNKKIQSTKDCCIDHCHKTMKIRGILCNRCNWSVGIWRENIELINNAKQYLQDSSSKSK